MVTLDDELAHYEVLDALVARARQQALANPMDAKRTTDLGIPDLPAKKSQRVPVLEAFFDGLARTTADVFILRLVAGFEGRAAAHLSNAVGTARGAVKSAILDSEPFGRAAEKLVRHAKDYTLHNLQGLADSYPTADVSSLNELREHRNHVAHGGRFGALSTYSDPRKVHNDLSRLLAILEGEPE